MKGNPLPVRWWVERPEIVDGMYFKDKPPSIHPGDTLVYYAVGGDGRLCGVAEVTGGGSAQFPIPASWTPPMRAKFRWRMPVRLLSKCAAGKTAPRLADFHNKRIGQGSYQWLEDEKAQRIIAAIAACAET